MKVVPAILHIRIFIILVASVPAVHLWSPRTSLNRRAPVCRTKSCSTRGKLYYENMDPSANPCEDFFQFACGSWAHLNPRPPFYAFWDVEVILDLDALRKMKKILTEHTWDDETPDQKRVKATYQFCLRIPDLPRGPIHDIYKNFEAATQNIKPSVWDYHDALLRLTGESAFFHYKIVINQYADYTPILEISRPLSIYGSIYHKGTWTDNELKNYKLFLKDIYRAINTVSATPIPDSLIDTEIEELIAFRKRMYQMTAENTDTNRFEAMRLDVLEHYYKMLVKKSAYNTALRPSGINWERIVKILYVDDDGEAIKKKRIVALRSSAYFMALERLLFVTARHTAKQHIMIYFMERHLVYSERMKQKLAAAFSPEVKPTGYIMGDMPRWVSCLKMSDLQHDLGKMYADLYSNELVNHQVEDLVFHLKEVIKKEIRSSTWLKGMSQISTISSVDRIRTMVGFPKWYFDPTSEKDTFDMPPVRASATFNPIKKEVYVTTSLLQPPLFDTAVPYVLNIGALGSIIGHELYHSFGDCGVYPLADGPLYVAWWKSDTRKSCLKQKDCFVDVFNSYAKEKLHSVVDLTEVDAKRTFPEDVADVMGLQAAYAYYKEVVDTGHKCQVLPYFEDYTCDQMFYMAFANAMCGSSDPKYYSQKYTEFIHNEHSIRVNGAVMNDLNFGKAFGCPAGSPMNPYKKCHLWRSDSSTSRRASRVNPLRNKPPIRGFRR